MAKDKTEAMAECKHFKAKAQYMYEELYNFVNKSMPYKGDTAETSQKLCLLDHLSNFEHCINGTTPEDFKEK